MLSTALLLKGNFQLDAFFSALIVLLYSVSFATALLMVNGDVYYFRSPQVRSILPSMCKKM